MLPRIFRHPDRLRIDVTYGPDGVSFAPVWQEGSQSEPVPLPLGDAVQRYLGQREFQRLALLDALLIEGVLQEVSGSYLLPIAAVYDLEKSERGFLGIPEPESVRVTLRSRGAVGARHFAVEARVAHPAYGLLDQVGERKGAFYLLPNDQVVLLPSRTAALLDAVEKRPTSLEDQPGYVARIQRLAREAGAELDPYLTREEYHLVDEIDIGVEQHAPDHISLQLRLPGLDQETADAVAARADQLTGYVPLPVGAGRRRLFFTPKATEQIRQWRDRREIRGADVPRFLLNPAPFLPDFIDLDRFSDRVKGLVQRVYRARPYLNVLSKTEREWFLDPGVRLEPVDNAGEPAVGAGGHQGDRGTEAGDEAPPSIDLNRFEDLVAEAADRGEDFVLTDDGWVEVPQDGGRFVEAARQMETVCPGGRVDWTRLPYVLDIFTNIEELEYSPELRAQREAWVEEESGEEPSGFLKSLYPHQKEGLSWLKRQRRLKLGGLLADDMGLGKTAQVLAFIAHLRERGELRPSLVVLPRAVWENWASEMERFVQGLRPYLHGGPGRLRDPEALARQEVVLTTYETMARDQLLLGQVDWQLVACDEAQKIKNMTAMATNAAKALKARTRLALTGTPVENNLGELWCIVDFVQPGHLGSYQAFRKRFEDRIRSEEIAVAEAAERELQQELLPIYKRRTKQEHLADQLPPIASHECPVRMGTLQYQRYREILEAYQGKKGAALWALQMLLQVCAHPLLVNDEWVSLSTPELLNDVPKLQETVRILDQIRAAGEKAVIVTHWKGMQHILQRVIRDRFGLHAWIINGETGDRKGVVDAFSGVPGFGVIILSPKAGGVGLNVTAANHVIHYTRWWNPAVENQATDRVYRIGQTRPVSVYYPIVKGERSPSVEEVLSRVLNEKRALASSVIVPSSALDSRKQAAFELGLVH